MLSVVIPVYFEGPHLTTVLSVIRATLTQLDYPFEMIVVDDGSTDNTWAILAAEAQADPCLRAIRLSRNFGKEAALCAGLEVARGDAVVVMDGDLQHPPSLIPDMVRIWRAGQADIVEGVKMQRQRESMLSRLGAAGFYRIMNALAGYDLENATDFKLLDRRVVDAWLRLGERSLFFRGMTAWLGFRRIQLPFEVAERAGGRSRWSALRLIALAVNAVTAFSSKPLRFVTITGGVFLLTAILLGIQTFLRWVLGEAVSGFTTVILLELIIGSLLMISLGVIGEYMARIYEEVKARPRYVILQMIE